MDGASEDLRLPTETDDAARTTMINGFDTTGMASMDDATRKLVERRTRLLGPAYRLFYKNPVVVRRGRGTRLFDDRGDEYLDAYNNVPAVGHAHPRVVAAVAEQMATLCTHTRYLHDGILRYAEDLLGSLGGRLGHVMFTCTGSEANDLALRIAKHRTGHRGFIVTAEAYHGNSDLTASLSPALGDRSLLGPWVRRVPTPDSYRRDPATMGAWLAAEVAGQIEDLRRRGEGVAAFIADAIFSSDGIYDRPTDLLAPVAEVVRKAGGLLIADEVQAGFTRTGEAMWGFERHGVEPDIVTLGKPMGNGFPVAAVALAPDVVAGFGADTRYFNTFGGNSVAIAAAQATLDVIRDEGLQANAARIGRALKDGLRDLARRHEGIGDVRGSGLYLGVEMVRDRDAKAPDAETAMAAVNGLRERRVLISATGRHANILKIRPPLVFSEADASRLLGELDATLRDIGART